MAEPDVVLFDGTCNFCNAAVKFVLDHERDHALSFAALQSDAGRARLARVLGEAAARDLVGSSADTGKSDPSSVVLLEGERAFVCSSASLRIARHLRAPWRWAVVLVVVPRPLRDAVYRWFARHRYRWFGRSEICRVPSPELEARFL